MKQSNAEIHLHLHVHEGASPEAVRAAAEELVCVGANGASPSPATDEDRATEFVRRAYLESEHRAKPLLEFLADNPGRHIPYTEVSEALGFESSRSLPGLLGSFTRRADHRYEGQQPFERHWRGGSWHLLMSGENAAIINALR